MLEILEVNFTVLVGAHKLAFNDSLLRVYLDTPVLAKVINDNISIAPALFLRIEPNPVSTEKILLFAF